jgi:hypothetical protein
LRITTVVFKIPGDERCEHLVVFFTQRALLDEYLIHTPRLVHQPGAGCRHQLISTNKVHLQRDDSKKQVLIGA